MKLLFYLDKIQADEMYRLKRYIYADYFNTNERLKTLFEAIRAAKAGKAHYAEIDAVAVYGRVFPKNKKSIMDDDFSGILKLVRGFVAQEEYNRDDEGRTHYQLLGLDSRKAKQQFKLLVNREAQKYETKKILQRIDSRDNYLQDMLIAQQKLQYYTIYENHGKITNKALQELMYAIDRFYIVSKMAFGNVMLQRTVLMQYRFDHGIMPDFQEIIRQIPVREFPLIHIRYNMYMMWKDEASQGFDQCKNILLEYRERFSLQDQKSLLLGLINFCRMSTHPQVWNKRQLELYEQYFEQGFCYSGLNQRKQQISLHHFKNYMNLLIELNDFDGFKKLEKTYGIKVFYENKAQKRFVNQYNSTALYFAQYLYYKKNKRAIGEEFAYDTAFQYIRNMERELATGKQEYPDIFYRILYEILVLKIYFEQKKGFANRRSAFYKYIKNQKYINPVFSHSYLNFANIILKLYRLKSKPKNIAHLQQLRDDIAEMRVVERIWLNDKLDDLQ